MNTNHDDSERGTAWKFLSVALALMILSYGIAAEDDDADGSHKKGLPTTLLNEPVDSQGRSFEGQFLYVGDFSRACILKIAPDGTSTVYAKVPNPCCMFFDENGNLFVAGGEGIWKITPTSDGSTATQENGHVNAIVKGLSHAKGLARDGKGYIWFTEYHRGTIPGEFVKGTDIPKVRPGTLQKVSPEGKVEIVEESIEAPYSLTTGPDGSIYLSKQLGGILYRYAPDGKKSVVDKGISFTRNAIFDPEGNIFLESGQGIEKIDTKGKRSVFFEWKSDGLGATHPVGLAIDANGTMYSSDWVKVDGQANKGIIFRYTTDGKRKIFTKVGVSPSWMVFWPQGKGSKKKN